MPTVVTDCCCRQPRFSSKATTLILLNKVTGEVLWRRDLIIPNEADSHGVAVVGDEVIANYHYSLGNPDGGNNNRYQIWNTSDSPFVNITTNKIAPSAGAATNLGRTSWARKNSDDTFYWLADVSGNHYLCRTTPGGDYATTSFLINPLAPLYKDVGVTVVSGNERVIWQDTTAVRAKYRDIVPGATPSWAAAATSFGTGLMRGDGTNFYEVISGPTLKVYDGTATLVDSVALANVTLSGATYAFQTGRPAAASSTGVLCQVTNVASPFDSKWIFVDPTTGASVGNPIAATNRTQADGAIVFETAQDAGDSNKWKVRALDTTANTQTWLAPTITGTAEVAASTYCVLESGVAYIRGNESGVNKISAVQYDGTLLWNRTDLGAPYAISVGTAGVFVATSSVTI